MFHRFYGLSRCKNTKQSQWLQNNPGRSTRHEHDKSRREHQRRNRTRAQQLARPQLQDQRK